LVVTLVANVLPSGEFAQTPPATIDRGSGGGDANDVDEEVSPEPKSDGFNADERLRKLDLYERTKDPDGPSSRRSPSLLSKAVVALAVTEDRIIVGPHPTVPPPLPILGQERLSLVEAGHVWETIQTGDALAEFIPPMRYVAENDESLCPRLGNASSLKPTDMDTEGLWRAPVDLLSPEKSSLEPLSWTFPPRDAESLVWLAVALWGTSGWLRDTLPFEEVRRWPCRVPHLR
jgi:hypothetical protein